MELVAATSLLSGIEGRDPCGLESREGFRDPPCLSAAALTWMDLRAWIWLGKMRGCGGKASALPHRLPVRGPGPHAVETTRGEWRAGVDRWPMKGKICSGFRHMTRGRILTHPLLHSQGGSVGRDVPQSNCQRLGTTGCDIRDHHVNLIETGGSRG